MIKIYTFLFTGVFIFSNINTQKIWATTIEDFTKKDKLVRAQKLNFSADSDEQNFSSLSISSTEREEENLLNKDKESSEFSENGVSSESNDEEAVAPPKIDTGRRRSITEIVQAGTEMVYASLNRIWSPPLSSSRLYDNDGNESCNDEKLSKSLSPKNAMSHKSKIRSNTAPLSPTSKILKGSKYLRRVSYPEMTIPEFSIDPNSHFQRMNDYVAMNRILSIEAQNLDKSDIKHILESPRFELTPEIKKKFIKNFTLEYSLDSRNTSHLDRWNKNFYKVYQYIKEYSHLIDMPDLLHIFSSPKFQLDPVSQQHLIKGLSILYDRNKFGEAHHPVSVINNGFYCLLERIGLIKMTDNEIENEIKQLEARELNPNDEISKSKFQEYDGVRQLIANIEGLFKKRQKAKESSIKLEQNYLESSRYNQYHKELFEKIKNLQRIREQISEMNKTFALHFKRFKEVDPAFAIYIEDFPCDKCRETQINLEVKLASNNILSSQIIAHSLIKRKISPSLLSPSLQSIPESKSTSSSENDTFQREIGIFKLDESENER